MQGFYVAGLFQCLGQHGKQSSDVHQSAMQFITNVVFIPYLAIRQQPPGSPGTTTSPQEVPDRIPYYAPVMGAIAGVVGVVSLVWAVAGRPEYGGLLERREWFVHAFTTNRVFFAFFLDTAFYTLWQIIFLEDADRKFRFVPFAGLVAWLLAGGPRKAEKA